jgi:hypothetical protein
MIQVGNLSKSFGTQVIFDDIGNTPFPSGEGCKSAGPGVPDDFHIRKLIACVGAGRSYQYESSPN